MTKEVVSSLGRLLVVLFEIEDFTLLGLIQNSHLNNSSTNRSLVFYKWIPEDKDSFFRSCSELAANEDKHSSAHVKGGRSLNEVQHARRSVALV